MASSLIALVYVGRVLEVVWLREPSAQVAEVGDPPPSMLLPLVVLALATIYFGIDTAMDRRRSRPTPRRSLLGGLR